VSWLDDCLLSSSSGTQRNPERHFYIFINGKSLLLHEEGVEIVLDLLYLRIAPRCRLNKKWSEAAATFVLVSGSPRDFPSRACSPYRIRMDWYVFFLKGALCRWCSLPPTHHGVLHGLHVFFRRITVVYRASGFARAFIFSGTFDLSPLR
jgi:hypothetical protein